MFTGWIFLWIMMPTYTFQKVWLPKIMTATDSTYFGRQGTSLLMMTFPGLLVAIVGSIYVHMTKKSAYDVKPKVSKHYVQTWKKPFIKKGPLGILSAVELSFCLMFLALVVWSLSVYITNDSPSVTEKAAKALGITLWQMKLRSVAYRLGFVGKLCSAFLFFPVARASTILPLVGLTSESSIRYHVWLGHLVMTLFTSHGLCFLVVCIYSHNLHLMLEWTEDVAIPAGEIALVCGLLMWITALPRIRRKAFELFHYTHHMYIVFLLFFLLHTGISSYCYILPGIYLFTKDINVVKIVHIGLPFVAATQPLNSLAFVFDGVNFGAPDYTFAAYSMVIVAAVSIPSMIFLSKGLEFIGIWTGLTIYMTLRTMASIWRMAAARGPWTFIHK